MLVFLGRARESKIISGVLRAATKFWREKLRAAVKRRGNGTSLKKERRTSAELCTKKSESNNERIPFLQPKKTPLVFTSMQRLKEQEKAPYNTSKRSKEDVMKRKQFGSLEIVITKRKMQLPPALVKKRKGCQSNSVADEISFPENLDDHFNQGLLGSMERGFENAMMKDKLLISQESPKPQIFVKASKQPVLSATTRSNCEAEETTLTKTPQKNHPQKFKIPETPLLNNTSEISQVGKSSIPRTPQCQLLKPRQEKNWQSCSIVPETPLLDGIHVNYCETRQTLYTPEIPVAQMKDQNKEKRGGCVRSCGKSFVQVVPETPNLKLKSTDELSLYD